MRGPQHDAAIGLPDGYIPLDRSRWEAEGRRWARLREAMDSDARETQEQLRDRLRSLRGAAADDPLRATLDVADPSRMAEACATVALFASGDRARPALACVGLPAVGGRRVAAATDSYIAAVDFGAGAALADEQASAAAPVPIVHPSMLALAEGDGSALTGIHVDGDRMLYETSEGGERALNRDHRAYAFPDISMLLDPARDAGPLPIDLSTGRLEGEFASGGHVEVGVEDLERLVARVDAEERARHKALGPGKRTTRTAGVIFNLSAYGPPSIEGVCSRHDGCGQLHFMSDPVPLGAYRTRVPAGSASSTCISTRHIAKIIRAAKRRGAHSLKFGVRHRARGSEFRSPVWCEVAEGLGVCAMPVRIE